MTLLCSYKPETFPNCLLRLVNLIIDTVCYCPEDTFKIQLIKIMQMSPQSYWTQTVMASFVVRIRTIQIAAKPNADVLECDR